MDSDKQVPVRVDFGGGWLDLGKFARSKAFIVNCTIRPLVSLEHWGYEKCGGLGGSAACGELTGENREAAGWQDSAVIHETGLCVWRSGASPVLEMKANPDWLLGKMALRWTGKPHCTEAVIDYKRPYDEIAHAGAVAHDAVKLKSVWRLGEAIRLSHYAQVEEGMEVPRDLPTGAIANKLCGSGWGGYELILFHDVSDRDAFASNRVGCVKIEPYMR
jgi:mevalonate kinase